MDRDERPGTDGVTYAAYDGRLARDLDDLEESEEGAAPADSALAFPGVRTTGENFRPMEIHDGIVMGVRRISGSVNMIAYDLHADMLERPEPEED